MGTINKGDLMGSLNDLDKHADDAQRKVREGADDARERANDWVDDNY